jgi:putative RNA 2'-phosphotransferase
MSYDPVRLSKTMAFLLRHKPEAGNLELDDRGFVELEALCEAVGKLMRRTVEPGDVQQLVRTARVQRFEVVHTRIRAVRERRAPPPRPVAPDILYHACTADQVDRYRAQGCLRAADQRPVWLSTDESQAWRAAHRMSGEPRVLFVDTARGRRRRLRLQKHRRNGLYMARSLSLSDVLNLQPNFAEQLSAGGIPVAMGDDGEPRMALIRVTRRSGVTWEVAKGKLEPGEPPERAGAREVREEMGVDCDFRVDELVGLVRYGFMAPGGLPRLKTIYLYLLTPLGEMGSFSPSEREGIHDVRWFTPEEACRAVTHTSLVPVMKKARELVRARDSAEGVGGDEGGDEVEVDSR